MAHKYDVQEIDRLFWSRYDKKFYRLGRLTPILFPNRIHYISSFPLHLLPFLKSAK